MIIRRIIAQKPARKSTAKQGIVGDRFQRDKRLIRKTTIVTLEAVTYGKLC